jgi:hypothetical protein
MKRNKIELSRELRLKTLFYILKGKDLHETAMELNIKVKCLKYRLTLLYKFYGVKNRIELMALYINIPLEIRKMLLKDKNPIVRSISYKTKEQFKKNNENILPIGLKF